MRDGGKLADIRTHFGNHSPSRHPVNSGNAGPGLHRRCERAHLLLNALIEFRNPFGEFIPVRQPLLQQESMVFV
jgi:hypothetical protein